MKKTLTVKTPGKLYIMGEYGVVYGTHALILTTNSTLNITLKPSPQSRLHSAHFSKPVLFDMTTFKAVEHDFKPWALAIETTIRYLQQKGLTLTPCEIVIESGLDDAQQHSYGLGSSAALVVGLCDALTQWAGLTLDALTLTKLAIYSQWSRQHTNSFGDVATSSFKETLLYHKVDASWLSHLKGDLKDILEQPWQGLVCEPLKHPKIPLLIFNTGVKTPSETLVSAVAPFFQSPEAASWLQAMDQSVMRAKNALIEGKFSQFNEAMHLQRDLHTKLTHTTQAPLFIKAYHTLDNLYQPWRQASKFSGAGGGDNYLISLTKDAFKLGDWRAIQQPYPLIQSAIKGVLE